jgi:hypothetical protein
MASDELFYDIDSAPLGKDHAEDKDEVEALPIRIKPFFSEQQMDEAQYEYYQDLLNKL